MRLEGEFHVSNELAYAGEDIGPAFAPSDNTSVPPFCIPLTMLHRVVSDSANSIQTAALSRGRRPTTSTRRPAGFSLPTAYGPHSAPRTFSTRLPPSPHPAGASWISSQSARACTLVGPRVGGISDGSSQRAHCHRGPVACTSSQRPEGGRCCATFSTPPTPPHRLPSPAPSRCHAQQLAIVQLCAALRPLQSRGLSPGAPGFPSCGFREWCSTKTITLEIAHSQQGARAGRERGCAWRFAPRLPAAACL